MTERLPAYGESPYYNIITPWLLVSHDDDGTLKGGVTVGYDTVDTINSQANLITNKIAPVNAGSDQQLGVQIVMTGQSTLAAGKFRIPLALRAVTGGTEGLDALNITVQQESASSRCYLNGIELTFNNLKGNDDLDPVDVNHFGMTVDAYGGFSIGPAAIAIRTGQASSTWQRGLYIPAGSITASTGLAIDYAGNGAGRKFQVDEVGNVFIGSHLKFPTSSVAPTAGPAIYNNGGVAFTFVSGSDSFRWFSNNLGTELMRLTNAGILCVGHSVTTNAGAKDIVLSTGSGGDGAELRTVNAAGTGTYTLVRGDASNRVQIAPDGGDILWGRALVALGAGGAATLGQVGGSGPATAAQNTWMRVVDSAGATFWVPAWK